MGIKNQSRVRSYFGRGLQKALMTVELFGRNELANHAAAGAYGFLLSAAPVFIMVAIIITRAFGAWPEWVTSLLGQIDELAGEFSIDLSLSTILENRRFGIPAIVTGLNLLWTARVFALSLQRGTRVIFLATERPSFWRENLLTFGIEFAVVLYALAYAVSSRLTLHIVRSAGLLLQVPLLDPLMRLVSLLLPVIGLGILTFAAYRLVPFEHPGFKGSFRGTLLCVGLYSLVSLGFRELVDLTRYNLLYGTLGNLLVFLANVYFFFVFFYWGAQYAFVEESFDELSFQHFRRVAKDRESSGRIERRVFAFPRKLMQNYARTIADGAFLYRTGEEVAEVFFIIEGNVDVFMPTETGVELLESRVHEGGFVGETEYLLNERRGGSAKAQGDCLVLALPPPFFSRILHSDNESAIHVIESLSMRLQSTRSRIKGGGAALPDDPDCAE